MEFDQRNLRVFVSSKMAELAEERQAIQTALKELFIATFVFEADAGARETTIEQTFVEELREADLYIGLFWRGYGEYTMQEYQTAGDLGMDRLIFEKRVAVEQRDSELQQFLDGIAHVREGVTIRWFTTQDELRTFVKQDVQKWLTSKARRSRHQDPRAIQPELLPCLCDREQQDQELQTALVPTLREKRTRPSVLIVHGHELEGHGHYVNRLELQSLLDILTLASVRGQGKVVRINEALRANQSQRDFGITLRMALAKRLQVAYQEDDRFLVEFARRHQLKALVPVLSVQSSEQMRGQGTLLEKTCAYVAEFPDLPEGLLVSFLVCFHYEDTAPQEAPEQGWRRWWPWRTRPSTADGDRVLREELQSCREKYHGDPRLHFVELPPLTSPTPEHVFRWLDYDQVKHHVPFVPQREVMNLFAGRPNLPMDELYEKLLELLPS
ncbi:MAG: DUF4062 domain-containing protein [Deltaproteobacteria bacterium]|nr:DUF4062 domain-containing protein [Deltaproteobacteria bacterium]